MNSWHPFWCGSACYALSKMGCESFSKSKFSLVMYMIRWIISHKSQFLYAYLHILFKHRNADKEKNSIEFLLFQPKPFWLLDKMNSCFQNSLVFSIVFISSKIHCKYICFPYSFGGIKKQFSYINGAIHAYYYSLLS